MPLSMIKGLIFASLSVFIANVATKSTCPSICDDVTIKMISWFGRENDFV